MTLKQRTGLLFFMVAMASFIIGSVMVLDNISGNSSVLFLSVMLVFLGSYMTLAE